MLQPDYAALLAAPWGTDPFPHIVVPHFVPPGSLRAVLIDLPPLEKRGSISPASIRQGPAALALVRELERPALRAASAERFALDLSDAPTMLTVLIWTTDRDGRIHFDSTAKRVTVRPYFSPESDTFTRHEGGLTLLRGPDDLEDYTMEVPPVNGTLLVFQNSPPARHGHPVFTGRWISLRLNYVSAAGNAPRIAAAPDISLCQTRDKGGLTTGGD